MNSVKKYLFLRFIRRPRAVHDLRSQTWFMFIWVDDNWAGAAGVLGAGRVRPSLAFVFPSRSDRIARESTQRCGQCPAAISSTTLAVHGFLVPRPDRLDFPGCVLPSNCYRTNLGNTKNISDPNPQRRTPAPLRIYDRLSCEQIRMAQQTSALKTKRRDHPPHNFVMSIQGNP
jgi:hypothetical protein